MKQLSFLLLSALVAAGCPVTQPECSSDAMCAAGETCMGGRCRARTDDAGVDGSGGVDAPRPDLCPGGGATTISGVVRIPAGTLPVPGAVVYVASGPPDPIPTGVGASCLRCDSMITNAIGTPTRTAVDGTFTLPAAPGENVRLVVQIGKWRREATIARVDECVENFVDAEATRLPRNRFEGHIPRIALTTGSCDGMECLLRKLGIEDSEFTTPDGPGRVNLFADVVCTPVPPPLPMICESGRRRFDDSLGGDDFPDASDWWASADNLREYDVVMHSCECSETTDNKPPAALEALNDYADLGGRVFLTHYHYAWLEHSTDSTWASVATWNGTGDFDSVDARIETSHPRGAMLADWLMLPEVGGSSTLGTIRLFEARQSLTAVDPVAVPWISIGGTPAYFSFDTPYGAPDAEACGRVVFSDIHVASADTAMSNPFGGGEPPPFPVGCTSELLAQEKALIFLLFDLTNCVGPEIPF